jgi:hypothetical protein
MASKKTSSSARKLGLGAAIGAGLAAAAAGAYFLYGSRNAAKNRKKVKGWMLKARGEVVEQIEKMRELSWEDYEKAVDRVMDRYRKMESTSTAEVNELAKELKSHWKNITSSVSGPAKKKTSRKKTAKKKSARA